MDTMDKVLDALKKGAKVLTGGKRGSEKGYFHEPTVLIDVDHSMKVMKEETFGPLLPIMPFDTDDEAVKLANDTVYGLECQQGNKRGKTEVPDFQGDVGMSGSMAEDSGRKIHISYIDGTNYRLKYAKDANGDRKSVV